MDNKPALPEPLRALLELLASGQRCRVVATPRRLQVDRADGGTDDLAGFAWSRESHAQILTVAEDGIAVPDGYGLQIVGDIVVLERAPDPLLHTDELVRAHWLSPLAGGLLRASLALGKNILLAGDGMPTRTLAAALVGEGRRPGVLLHGAVPTTWVSLPSVEAAIAAGCDRIGAWFLPPAKVFEAMAHAAGVVGTIQAHSLERTLMRFEYAVETHLHRTAAPLHVLSAVDLLVMLGRGAQPRVQQIAEIVLTEDGYRPRMLFSTGLPPMPSALVPVAAPSFVGEFAAIGQGVLADELRAVAAPQPPAEVTPRPAPEPPIMPAALPSMPPAGNDESGGPLPPVPEPLPPLDPRLATAPPPGWELDQLEDEVSLGAHSAGGSESYEAAALAATYGLGPPPTPGGTVAGSFEDALRRVQEDEPEADEDFYEGK